MDRTRSLFFRKILFVTISECYIFYILYFHQDYFGVCSEPVIKDNVVVVYEVLEEMLDNGFPLATESNILKELIKPPTILRTVVNTITGMEKEETKLLPSWVWLSPVWCTVLSACLWGSQMSRCFNFVRYSLWLWPEICFSYVEKALISVTIKYASLKSISFWL